MEKRNTDTYILNVASSAAFQPGPLMSTYYATKSYVYQLTEALYYEEKKKTCTHLTCRFFYVPEAARQNMREYS